MSAEQNECPECGGSHEIPVFNMGAFGTEPCPVCGEDHSKESVKDN